MIIKDFTKYSFHTWPSNPISKSTVICKFLSPVEVTTHALEIKRGDLSLFKLVASRTTLNGEGKIKKTNLKVQLGGGIRNLRQIAFWVDHGVNTIVLGTLAVQNQKILKTACNLFPGKIAVAIDVRNNFLAIKGWIKQTKINFINFS